MIANRNAVIAGSVAVILAIAVIAAFLLSRPNVPDFSEYPAGQARKDAFFSYMLPLVEQRNQEIRATRQEVRSWRQQGGELSGSQESRLQDLAEKYRIDSFDPASEKDWDKLLARLDVVPPSLALAQAANESAWGTSRFARTAHNYFGQWCFSKGCGVVPKSRDTGKTHEVASFRSPKASVEAYMQNLNGHPAYQTLRQIRQQLRQNDEPITGIALAGGLQKYSERGDEYISELRHMIRYNELTQYDLANNN